MSDLTFTQLMSAENFDEMLRMAKEEPERLEQLFRDEVEKFIQSASPQMQEALKGLQLDIDTLRLEHDGLQIDLAGKMFNLMAEKYKELADILNNGSASEVYKEVKSVQETIEFNLDDGKLPETNTDDK